MVRPLSLLKLTPVPPAETATRCPVIMPAWFGRVIVLSMSVRALSVNAPSRIRRCMLGAPSSPTRAIASGRSPSMEITITWRIGGSDSAPDPNRGSATTSTGSAGSAGSAGSSKVG